MVSLRLLHLSVIIIASTITQIVIIANLSSIIVIYTRLFAIMDYASWAYYWNWNDEMYFIVLNATICCVHYFHIFILIFSLLYELRYCMLAYWQEIIVVVVVVVMHNWNYYRMEDLYMSFYRLGYLRYCGLWYSCNILQPA